MKNKLTTQQIVKIKNIHQAGKEASHGWVKYPSYQVDFDTETHNKPFRVCTKLHVNTACTILVKHLLFLS